MTNHLDKEILLKQIEEAAQKKIISKKEMLAAFNQGQGLRPTTMGASLSLTEVISMIGSGIIFIGIAIFISDHWNALTSLNKILITLGSGFISYIVAVLFQNDSRVRMVASSFFLLSALLIPIGLAVTLDIAGVDVNSNSISCLISAVSLSIFLFSYMALKKDLLLLFSVLYGTWLFYSLMNLIYPTGSSDFYFYCTIVVGMSWISLGNFLEQSGKNSLTGFLYGFGVLGLLGALFALNLEHKHSIWEWVFPLALAVVIYLGVLIRASSFLTFSCLFLIAYLLEITDRYFRASIGWPLALILMGFLLIVVSYFYFQVKKKYFR